MTDVKADGNSATDTTARIKRTCLFGPLEIDYDDRVLTPRSWTLQQSRWAATVAESVPSGPILELCAGAGHIGLAAALLADRALVQVEADPVAADYASANAARAGLQDRVEIRNERLETALRGTERFPLVIADPPYLPSADTVRWPDDPITAIDGGGDGLDITRACLVVAAEHLLSGGYLLLQAAGPQQAGQVVSLLPGLAKDTLRHKATQVVDDQRAIVLLARL